MDDKKKVENENQEKGLLTFLKQTQEGKYAKIDTRSLSYARIKEQREEISLEDEYYYGVS
ncbi:MAG: hypothetical protein V2A65_01885 [Candidatus Omnitrophota bacterium]